MTDVQLRAIIASSNEKQCKDLVNQMQQFGVSTEVVSTAAEAVAAFAEDHHPLVFLACQLDDGSGFDAVQEIQEQQGGEDCVITALSSTKGRNLPAEIDQSLEAGMDFHLEYPFEKEALDEVMTFSKSQLGQNNTAHHQPMFTLAE